MEEPGLRSAKKPTLPHGPRRKGRNWKGEGGQLILRQLIFSLTKRTPFVSFIKVKGKGTFPPSVRCLFLAEGAFLISMIYGKISAKGKEVKGSEEVDQHGLSVGGFGGLFLRLRWIRRQRRQGEMPEVRSSFHH